ncbi:hypothetical protein [Halobaculum lipolyticum]|uniref:DUF955 domain-containing protein n=1 Tax=Halobaculum lipolyticum TaxID=3032001 RepID=A0ABD5WG43_9EURY|nr:hypothetical protein [Halobaculum sp. DT31]
MAHQIGASVEIVADVEWEYGTANGICHHPKWSGGKPLIEVRDRQNCADLARTILHEYAHAQLHVGIDSEVERAKREVEAEGVAYVVARACGLEASGSAFYLASWTDEDTEVTRERFDRICRTAGALLEILGYGALNQRLAISTRRRK